LKTIVFERRVEFCDTDMAGMMHFSNFFRFMEFAEQEYLRRHGLTVTWTEGDARFGFPRVAASCDYLKPAKFEQTLEIAVTLANLGEKSLTYEFEFRHAGLTIAKGQMTSVYCRVESDGHVSSTLIPQVFREKLIT
jgi:YbgC/YbaW family acyl-CoA thioester hydrolase